MTRYERDTMIGRFLSGTMPPSEEREFLSRVERDRELHRQLQAERLIRRSAKKEKAAVTGPSAASREQFLTMLAAVTAEQKGVPQASTPREPAIRRFFGNGLVRTGMILIAGALLTTGGVTMLNDTPEPRIGRPAGASTPSSEQAPQLAPELPKQDRAPAATVESMPDAGAQVRQEATKAEPSSTTATAGTDRARRSTVGRQSEPERSRTPQTSASNKPSRLPNVRGTTASGPVTVQPPPIIKPSK